MLINFVISTSKKFLNDTQKLIIIYGIASGMAYLHSLDILHRDLKTSNICLDDNLFPKIRDFSTSKRRDEIKYSNTLKQTTVKFMAPEFMDNYEEYNRAKPIDVYSYSIILYQIMTNEDPYPGCSGLVITEKVMKNERPEFKKDIPECYKHLITCCWDKDPNLRPSFDQIVELLETKKEFITENVDEEKFRQYIEYVKGRRTVPCQPENDNEGSHQEEEGFVQNEEEERYEISINAAPIDLN